MVTDCEPLPTDRERVAAYVAACKVSKQAEPGRLAHAGRLDMIAEAAGDTRTRAEISASAEAHRERVAAWQARRAALKQLIESDECARIVWRIAGEGRTWEEVAAMEWRSVRGTHYRAGKGYAAISGIIPEEWTPGEPG